MHENIFFEVKNSLPKIKIENRDNRDTIISKFEKHFGTDLCFKHIEFGLQLPTNIFKCTFNLYCPLKSSRIPKKPALSIMVNSNNELFLNNETLIETDSFKQWIIDNFKIVQASESVKKEIKILWNTNTPVMNLELAILEIIKGLNYHYDQIAITKYDRQLCALSKEQLSDIHKTYPVNIIFDIGIPPPPPPPSITND